MILVTFVGSDFTGFVQSKILYSLHLKPTTYILIFFSLLLLNSCSETYIPSTTAVDRETVIIAELEVGERRVEIKVSTTFSSEEEPMFPNANNGEVRMSNLAADGVKNLALRDQKSQKIWFTDDFPFEEGDKLTLTSNFDELGLDPIYATTTTPISGKIVDATEATPVQSEEEGLKFNLNLELSDLEPDTYYHLMPYSTNDPIRIEKDYYNVKERVKSQSTIEDLSHLDGILIDNSTADDRSINLELSTSDILSYDPSHIYLLLKTVTKEYYDYHKTLSLQQEANQGPFDAPIPSYTNIERGQGIFVAYTTQLDSVLVK